MQKRENQEALDNKLSLMRFEIPKSWLFWKLQYILQALIGYKNIITYKHWKYFCVGRL